MVSIFFYYAPNFVRVPRTGVSRVYDEKWGRPFLHDEMYSLSGGRDVYQSSFPFGSSELTQRDFDDESL